MNSRIDLQLIFATVTILALGSLIQLSLDPDSILAHLGFIVLGVVVSLLFYRVDLNLIYAFKWHLYALTLGLLLLTLLFGTSVRGSTRWLSLFGLQFQTSEVVKPLLIVSLGAIITSLNQAKLKNQLAIILLSLPPSVMVFLQPDLGSALIFLGITGGLIFNSGIRLKHLILIGLIFALISPLSLILLKDYQKTRIVSFLNPTQDPLNKGYNSIQSTIAVGSGQIQGRGLGHGTQSKLRFLPEYQTDFVFASIAEELGLIGSLLLISSYGWLIFRLFSLAQSASQASNYLVIIGIITMFITQIVINIGMNIGLLPITGITLPLVSRGGTSMVVSLVSLGLALKLSQVSLSQRTRQNLTLTSFLD